MVIMVFQCGKRNFYAWNNDYRFFSHIHNSSQSQKKESDDKSNNGTLSFSHLSASRHAISEFYRKWINNWMGNIHWIFIQNHFNGIESITQYRFKSLWNYRFYWNDIIYLNLTIRFHNRTHGCTVIQHCIHTVCWLQLLIWMFFKKILWNQWKPFFGVKHSPLCPTVFSNNTNVQQRKKSIIKKATFQRRTNNIF